jgi:predicted Zn-dependent protease
MLSDLVRRINRLPSFQLIFTTMLVLAITAAGRGPVESFLRRGNRLMDQGLFTEAVAAYTRALQRNPSNAKVYYYRALANEMVNRQAAIADWHRFAESAITDSRMKEAVPQVQQRVQALEKKTELPDLLHPSRYVPKAGDYYPQVADASLGLQWTEFPVKVLAKDPPKEWKRALEESLETWMSVFPLQAVSTREQADIVISWVKLPKGNVGTERDSMQVRTEDERVVKRQRLSSIILDSSHRWSEREMHAAVLHELGHALGIGGHSDDSRDVMFPAEIESFEELSGKVPAGVAAGVAGLSVVGPPGVRSSIQISTKLTPRDINTLIRLYNCPGPLVYLK